jgi:hypothetical protein
MPEPPRRSELKRTEQAARAERLARSLRDNLRRRKEQARARTDADTAPEDGPDRSREPPA